MNKKVVVEFLQWLDYEYNLGEMGYFDMSTDEIRDSHRVFNKKLADVIEECGFSTYQEMIDFSQ